MYMYMCMHQPSSVVIPSSTSFFAAAGLRREEDNGEKVVTIGEFIRE
jgi:hypothetical protein